MFRKVRRHIKYLFHDHVVLPSPGHRGSESAQSRQFGLTMYPFIHMSQQVKKTALLRILPVRWPISSASRSANGCWSIHDNESAMYERERKLAITGTFPEQSRPILEAAHDQEVFDLPVSICSPNSSLKIIARIVGSSWHCTSDDLSSISSIVGPCGPGA